jgi:hypothetical protein
MTSRLNVFSTLTCVLLMACGLSGCGTINSKLATGMEDYMPQWAGGLPADAPARPGTAKYDQEMKERERERLRPKTDDAKTTDDKAKPSDTVGAVH